jgi:hypothetical protein
MTFKFENGRKQTAEAKVETAGGASTDDAGHSGMDMH